MIKAFRVFVAGKILRAAGNPTAAATLQVVQEASEHDPESSRHGCWFGISRKRHTNFQSEPSLFSQHMID
jgi:hypothetical protein